jgi:ubiquitin carboxyl-terminal hydrolase 5/13
MASVLQTIFSLPAFQRRYTELCKNHETTCTQALPADCVECQMHKVADGLLSGRYSHPANYAASPNPPPGSLQHASPTPVFQEEIKPAGFKALIGKGHVEFSTMKQQDSEEFFTYLITALRRDMQKHQDRSQNGVFRSIAFK